MQLIYKSASTVFAAACLYFLSAGTTYGQPGLNCTVGSMQVSVPGSGSKQARIEGATQVHLECSSTTSGPPLRTAKSTYPTSSRSGQVSWGTDHNAFDTHPVLSGSVVHRSAGAVNGVVVPSDR